MAEHHPLFLPICKTRSTLHTLFPVVEVWQKFVFNPLHIIRIVTIKFFYYAIKYIIRLIYLQAEVTGGTVRQLETLSVSYTRSVVAYVQRIKKLVKHTGKLGTLFNIWPTSQLQCFCN